MMERVNGQYIQFRETYNGRPKWVYYITGFTGPQLSDGSDSIGYVMNADKKTYTACRFNLKGQCLINGKWTLNWEH